MYEIYSIGDAAFLYQVLNGIAAFAQSDEYDALARIGVMLGVILVMARAAFSGGTQFPAGSLLGVVLVYTAFFSPSRQVAIIDIYTDQVRTVDNVPAGIALAGSQIGSFGYVITNLMEQIFATPRMTEQGYGAALETLKRVRLATISVYNLKMADEPTPDANWPRSWQQYIADCPLKGVQNEMRHKKESEIYNTPLMTEGLRFESNIWGTRQDLAKPYTEPTCSEAHARLVDYTRTSFLPYYKDVLAKKLRYHDVVELETRLQDALSSLGLDTSADDYLLTSALSAVYFAGVRQRYAEDFQPAYAVAVDDAVAQRNAQWFADESLFQHYMRPMMAFLEVFVFAMTPFLVLLFGLGAFGLHVIGAFLLTLVWINTWMPVLAVINLFQHMTASGKLSALAENGASVDTMAGLFQADSIVQTYLAVAGNMAAAVPALTAAFLFIGKQAVGANLMAQRLSSGSDTFKEEKAAPDSFHAGAMVNMPSPYTHSPSAGYTTLTDGSHLTPTYSWGDSHQLAISSAEGRSQSAASSFASSAGRRIVEAAGNNESGVTGGVFNSHEAASKSMSWAAAKDWSAGFSSGTEGSAAITDQMRTDLAYGLGLGLPLKEAIKWAAERGGIDPQTLKYLPDVAADVRGGQSASSIHTALERMGTRMENSYRNDERFQAQFNSALAHDYRQGHESSVFASEQLQQDQGLQRQASDVLAAQQDYRRVQAANQDFATRVGPMSEIDLAGMIKRDPETRDWLHQTLGKHELVPEAYKQARGMVLIYPDPHVRDIAAELRTLEAPRNLSDTRRAEIFAELGERLGLTRPRDLGDAEEHAEVGLDPASIGETKAKVEQGLDGPDKLGASIEADAEARIAQHRQAVEEGQDKVAFRSAENKANVEHHQEINKLEGQRQTEAGAEAAKELGTDANLASEVHKLQETAKTWVKDGAEWIEDQIDPAPPSVTGQIGPPPPSAPVESSGAPKEESNDPSIQKPE